MTSAEKWNLIVSKYKSLYHSPEDVIQKEWEMYCGELFEYKKLLGEIIAQPHISVGSGRALIPDIILNINGKDICDIELKRYCLQFDNAFENQLISYFNQKHLSIGMIVCNKIYLYHYEYLNEVIKKIEIPFEKDNPDGIALMEMLSKETFSEKTIYNYISEKLNREKNKQEIKQYLTDQWLKIAVKSKLLERYSEADIDEVLDNFTFKATLSSKSHVSPPLSEAVISTPTYISTKEDISNWILEWCHKKINNGEIAPFRSSFHTKRYTRYTTPDMDEIIYYQEEAKSGWNNGHFYAYEIDCSGGRLRMYIVFSNKNAPEYVRTNFAKIFAATGEMPKKDNWEWKFIFITKPFSYSTLTTKDEIHRELDSRFSQIRVKVSKLIKIIQ